MVSAQLNDELLVSRVAEGDPQAFASLFEKYGGYVHAVAHRICRDRSDAEDLTQEVFVQLWQQASHFDSGRSSVGQWLGMLARSRALDHLRRRSSLRRSPQDRPLSPTRGDRTLNPAASLLAREAKATVRRALNRLRTDHRTALELAFAHSHTHAVVAERLERPIGTVKTWIRKGLLSMRAELLEPPTGVDFDASGSFPSGSTLTVAATDASEMSDTPSLAGLSVLVVDDEPEVLQLLSVVLERAGARVVVSQSVHDAIDVLRTQWPDVLLADLDMPGQDGFSLMRQVTSLAESSHRELRAAAFTAHSRGEDRSRALRSGFSLHLSKPAHPLAVVAAVYSLAHARR